MFGLGTTGMFMVGLLTALLIACIVSWRINQKLVAMSCAFCLGLFVTLITIFYFYGGGDLVQIVFTK